MFVVSSCDQSSAGHPQSGDCGNLEEMRFHLLSILADAALGGEYEPAT
jgi:hypothetical protein